MNYLRLRRKVCRESPGAVRHVRLGRQALQFLTGRMMREGKGETNPALVYAEMRRWILGMHKGRKGALGLLYGLVLSCSGQQVEWTYHKTADGLHPSGEEQQMVWLMNRARAAPQSEGSLEVLV